MRQGELERLNAKLAAVGEIGSARLGKAEWANFSAVLDRIYRMMS